MVVLSEIQTQLLKLKALNKNNQKYRNCPKLCHRNGINKNKSFEVERLFTELRRQRLCSTKFKYYS